MLNLHKAEFLRSAVKVSDFPQDGRPQIVFAGKSNVGKSSVINRLLNRRSFARVSAQPGKTIHINYFSIDEKIYLVDLPGYGYARVSKAERDRWGRLMDTYFASGLMTLGIQIVDIRHAPTADDQTMSRWFLQTGVPLVVLANKLDKIKKSQREANLARIREVLCLPDSCRIIPFSAEKGDGRDEVLALLEACSAPHPAGPEMPASEGGMTLS
ncbi:MAG: YihA family ribosome biogenesis GTP-binding protein [Clostridiaceae bacterium]|jgi:GTP-binding protein|nr:YihA family ribosome biogenesis GTP-binding protein [Clostridiaceae bacterium]MCI9483345.1 YihA family ribosome biogenesis GTP-binding protein [Clostridiaceae bacterium]NBH78604.1 YihA family ribosome biogenesis GTP-binding protein [Clostridiaceae bacterium]NBI81341.1 YihA family ribosome biogenesis GTP-binding protein [Clostridiaceae bacterium]